MEVHLIASPVPKGRGGVRRLPEGAVEGGGVFHRVGHDGNPGVALPVQGGTNGRHPAIHHVRRGNHIRPRLDLAQGNPGQVGEGLVVVHLLPLEDAAVSMGGVLAHAHVANQVQLREPVLQGFHGLLDHPVAAIGLGALGILLQGNAEEHHLVHPGRQ